ncbi:phosphotransferase [Paenibacillus sp. HJL G12]|uniref:Phosphotransferase n=1 Tax=Paenibacillus dendrobii TaxID=2691084 RepID=A0A7X3IS05_9BACL|nr:phosphotransferase [Paenibacillus dendrobii]MWV47162.1 phosphotransferase [Paenibacillus dendrobii]
MLYSADLESIIPYYNNWSEIRFIDKGLSTDDKYYVKSKLDKQQYIIRISSVNILKRKQHEFETMKKIDELDLPIQKLIEFGVCPNNNYIYSLYSWIDGRDLEGEILFYNESEQYSIGFKAGSILRNLHQGNIMLENYNFIESVRRDLDKQKEEYDLCRYKVSNDKKIMNFIQENINCLKERPYTLLHGDFHIGNLIINDKKDVGVIDMNWYKFGDPFEEFKKLMFLSRRVSKEYATGQIDGYFNYEIPDNFFRITAVYVAINILFSTLWSSKIGPEELERDLKRINMVYDDYNGFSTNVPNWYNNKNVTKHIEGS